MSPARDNPTFDRVFVSASSDNRQTKELSLRRRNLLLKKSVFHDEAARRVIKQEEIDCCYCGHVSQLLFSRLT